MSDDARVKVVNIALNQLGQEPVVDLSDASIQGSNAAMKVLRVLDDAREMVLARHGWLCAMVYVTLQPAVIAGYVNWKYPYVYQLPGDGLEVWEIGGCPLTEYYSTWWSGRWEVGSIDTDQGPLKIVRARECGPLNVAYTRRASWGALESHLRDAVAWEAAARSCYSVTADVTRTSQLKKEAESKVMMAIGKEGTQEGGQEPLAPSIPAAIRAFSR